MSLTQLKKFIDKLHPLPEEEWQALSVLFFEMEISKGEFFTKAGKFEKEFAFILSGVLRTFFIDNSGREYNKGLYEADEFIGAFSALITGEKNLISIQALTDCGLLVASYRQLTELYSMCPAIERISRRLTEHFYVFNERREIQLISLDAEKRYQIFRKEHPELENRIQLFHIASYLGITPTQLSRIRAKRGG